MNIFSEAATIIREKGWTRDPLRQVPSTTKTCIGLALNRVIGYHSHTAEQLDTHSDFWNNFLFEKYGTWNVIQINDQILTSQEEAIALLEEAGRRWESRV